MTEPKFKVGQFWRTRDNKRVFIFKISENDLSITGAILEYGWSSKWRSTGKYESNNDELDLIELLSEVEIPTLEPELEIEPMQVWQHKFHSSAEKIVILHLKKESLFKDQKCWQILDDFNAYAYLSSELIKGRYKYIGKYEFKEKE